MKTILTIIIVVSLSFSVTHCSINGFMSDYSEGTRTGTISKFSQKGILFKTWEGEMILGGIKQSGTDITANTWNFTCLDENLISVLQKHQESGSRVNIAYNQFLIPPIWIDSSYLVNEIKK